MITMLLCGLWHGAAWTFVIWGAAHGAYLALHRLIFGKGDRNLGPVKGKGKYALDLGKRLLTFHIVAITWVFFRANDFETAVKYLSATFRLDGMFYVDSAVLFAGMVILVLDVTEELANSHAWLSERKINRTVRYAAAQMLLVSVIAAAIAHLNTLTPFIYFQF
jgi:alginate O-acetyltransferase complex protein AlgI